MFLLFFLSYLMFIFVCRSAVRKVSSAENESAVERRLLVGGLSTAKKWLCPRHTYLTRSMSVLQGGVVWVGDRKRGGGIIAIGQFPAVIRTSRTVRHLWSPRAQRHLATAANCTCQDWISDSTRHAPIATTTPSLHAIASDHPHAAICVRPVNGRRTCLPCGYSFSDEAPSLSVSATAGHSLVLRVCLALRQHGTQSSMRRANFLSCCSLLISQRRSGYKGWEG